MEKSRSSVRPLPIQNLRHSLSAFGDVLPVINELVAEKLFGVNIDALKLWDAISQREGYANDHSLSQVKAIECIQHHHVEGVNDAGKVCGAPKQPIASELYTAKRLGVDGRAIAKSGGFIDRLSRKTPVPVPAIGLRSCVVH